jgi:hypothetical protein
MGVFRYTPDSAARFLPIRIRRHNKQAQEMELDDFEWFIAEFSATQAEFYMDRQRVCGVLCGSI